MIVFRAPAPARAGKDIEALSEAAWDRKKGLQQAVSDGNGIEPFRMQIQSLVSYMKCQQAIRWHNLVVEKNPQRSLSSCVSGGQRSRLLFCHPCTGLTTAIFL